ncbi:TRAP transporter large permease subunit [bacterium]|nr:TRAP transporter large permease subunit [bacterium]
MILLLVILLIICAFLGTPLFIVIGGAALLGFYSIGLDSILVINEIYTKISGNSVLLAIPLFTFAGYVLAESGTPKRLINVSRAFLGWLPGGVAIVALVSCALFTAFTGASGVTIIALGGLLFTVLKNDQYPEKFSLGLITSSGSLGLLFPPSLAIILYGIVAEVSIDKLFIAGALPGILLIVMLSLYSIRKGAVSEICMQSFSFKDAWKALAGAAWEIPLPFVIIGGIYSGTFTPTEAASISAFYVLVVEVFIYRELSMFKDIPRIIVESMILVGGILIILGSSLGFTNYLIDQQVPMKMLGFMQNYITSKYVFLILLNIFLLIVGCIMDIFSAIVVVVPLIKPIAEAVGIDPVHLGIIFLINLQIGYSTPPVGLNLFIASFRFNQPILKLYHASLPFLVILLIALLIITYFPALSLFLVNVLSGG